MVPHTLGYKFSTGTLQKWCGILRASYWEALNFDQEARNLICPIISNINFDHLVEVVVLVRFPYYKVTVRLVKKSGWLFLWNTTYFSFSPTTLLMWIFWVCWLSPLWYNVDCSQLMSWFDCYQLHWSTQPWSSIQQEISSTKLCKPLLTHSISHSTFSIHCISLFLHFSYVFSFLEIIKHNMPKMLCIFSYLQY